MNAPFAPVLADVRLVDLADPGEIARLEGFVVGHPQGTPFHRPAWFVSVAKATGNEALALVQERGGEIVALLPLEAIPSPGFGRLLGSTGCAVGGGEVVKDPYYGGANGFEEVYQQVTRFSQNFMEYLEQNRSDSE